jgi:hypothetical protein
MSLKMTENNDFLKSGTSLFAVVRSKAKNKSRSKPTENQKLISFYRYFTEINGEKFVEFILLEDLKFKSLQKGKGNLDACKCFIPALNEETKSVNDALTQIVKNYTNRRSSSMNAFRDAYFVDKDENLKILDEWRQEIKSRYPDIDNIKNITKRLGENASKPQNFYRIFDILSVSNEMSQIMTKLNTKNEIDLEIEAQKILNTLVGVNKLKDIFKTWKENQKNSDEKFWQKLLEENSLILGQIFSIPVVILQSRAYVGGSGINGTGGNIVDFLLVNKLTKNTALIEIKTPNDQLLSKVSYSNKAYSLSTRLCKYLNQLEIYKDSLTKDYNTLSSNSHQDFNVFKPVCILIIGHAQNELIDNDKKKCFEFERSRNKDIQIITYDELFEKIKILVELLESKVSV